jgi:Protein tyrosine and serine/threonine kinase
MAWPVFLNSGHFRRETSAKLIRWLWIVLFLLFVVSLVIMELCQLSLATYLNGPMGDVRLEATDFAWQVASGLDYLHSNQLIASLDPKNVLLAQEYGRHVVKLQVASDFDEVCKFESNQNGNNWFIFV